MRITKLHPQAEALLARIGRTVAAHRLARRESQAQLGARAGVSRDTIMRLETGSGQVAAGSLASVLAVLGLDSALVRALDAQTIPPALLPKRGRGPRYEDFGEDLFGGEGHGGA